MHEKDEVKNSINLGFLPSMEYIGEGISLQEENNLQYQY